MNKSDDGTCLSIEGRNGFGASAEYTCETRKEIKVILLHDILRAFRGHSYFVEDSEKFEGN